MQVIDRARDGLGTIKVSIVPGTLLPVTKRLYSGALLDRQSLPSSTSSHLATIRVRSGLAPNREQAQVAAQLSPKILSCSKDLRQWRHKPFLSGVGHRQFEGTQYLWTIFEHLAFGRVRGNVKW